MSIRHSQDGVVSLTVAVVVFFAALAIAMSVQFIGIGDLQEGAQDQQAERAFQVADSCVQESLLRLSRNSSYTGDTLSVGSDSCTIVVTGGGSSRVITVTATAQQSTRRVQVDVSLSGSTVTVVDWAELTS